MEKTENLRFCQSCGMPLSDDRSLDGTEADGTKSTDYCTYCYQNGSFTADCTMEEMIEFCIPHLRKADPALTETEARENMQKYFPVLKRWAKG